MSLVTLRNISKKFQDTTAVRDVNLDIAPGEFFSILGPSGCGKTTLLRLIAGFEQPTSGTISFDAKDVTRVPTQQRGVGMVFQNYALFPHMTVFENVAFGLETQKVGKSEIREKVESILEAVRLSHKIMAPVPLLSGGEQQRVAVARALVVQPAVLLMDEPLSNLDVALRFSTREEIRALQRKTGITTIYVTHDQSEAMSLSDRIAVMHAGAVIQVGTPAQMYESPATSFVAEFLGGANVMTGRLMTAERKIQVRDVDIAIPLSILPGWSDGDASLIVKPEAIVLSFPVQKGEYRATIRHKEYLGFTTNFVVQIHDVHLRVTTVTTGVTKNLKIGDTVGLSFDWSRCTLLAQ